MSKSCPIIKINDAPEISNTPPSNDQWLELHDLANKFRGIYTFADYPNDKDISFFLQLPDSSEIINVRIFTEDLKAILIEADFLSSSLFHLITKKDYSSDVTTNIARHFLSIAFVNKNKLTKKELTLREKLDLPSPGKSRLRYVSITEKRPGLPSVLIDQSHVFLIQLILTFACRNFNKPSFDRMRTANSFIYKPQSDANLNHFKSWEKSRFELPTLAEFHDISLTEENAASKVSLSPQTWTIHSHFIPTDCPCPDGHFQPLLLSYLHPQPKESNSPYKDRLLIPFKNNLIKDLCHLSKGIVDSLKNRLAEADKKPTHILTTSPIVYLAVRETLKSSGISLIFAHDSDDAPYASYDAICDFLYTPENHIYRTLGYPLIQKTKAVLHIKLDDASPPVTRTIEIAGDTSLSNLHDAIQSVLNSDDDYPYEFFINTHDQTIHYSDENISLNTRLFIKPTDSTTLNSLYQTGFKKLTYIYDFGYNRKYHLTIRSLTPADAPPKTPCLLDSQGDTP